MIMVCGLNSYPERNTEESQLLNFIAALKSEFGDFYQIPEGGTNELAIKGCEEILTKEDIRLIIYAFQSAQEGRFQDL